MLEVEPARRAVQTIAGVQSPGEPERRVLLVLAQRRHAIAKRIERRELNVGRNRNRLSRQGGNPGDSALHGFLQAAIRDERPRERDRQRCRQPDADGRQRTAQSRKCARRRA